MNQLVQYLTKNWPSLWENLPSEMRDWIRIKKDLQDADLLNVLVEACKEKKTKREIKILLLETWAKAVSGDKPTTTTTLHPGPFPVSQIIPDNPAEPETKKTDSFWMVASGIIILIFILLSVFGGNIEKALGIDIPLVPFSPQTEPVEEVEVKTNTDINGELVVQGCTLVTLTDIGNPDWYDEEFDEQGNLINIKFNEKLPVLINRPQKLCLTDLEAWRTHMNLTGSDGVSMAEVHAFHICKKTELTAVISATLSNNCLTTVTNALLSAKELEVEPGIDKNGVKHPYPKQAGLVILPAWPPPSNGNQKDEENQPTKVIQTPWPTFTPTPDTVERARAVEQGKSDEGPQELDPVNMSELTSRSAPIWSKPGIDSVEIRMYESGVNTSWIAWAPSYKTAKWYFWVWETQTLADQASQAGCSSFVLEGVLIYEAKVSDTLTFVRNDSAGVAKYMFPANQTSVFGCYVWPTSTPAPTSTPQPTSPPAVPTYTPVPTATPQQPSGCQITISWSSLISNPSQVTGSGNSYLTKWNQNDDTYVGNVTEQAIFYCITDRPDSFEGVVWNQQYISLNGPKIDGYGEYNIPGTSIWVSDWWK